MKHSGFQLFANCNQLNQEGVLFCCPGLCLGRRQAGPSVVKTRGLPRCRLICYRRFSLPGGARMMNNKSIFKVR